MKKSNYSYTIEQLEDAVKSSSSIAQVLQKLNLNASGGAYKSIHHHIKTNKLDVTHFTGQAHNKGKKYFKPVIPLTEILEGLHPHYQTFKLKERLFRDAIFDRKCSCCSLTTWMDKQIPLELDHKWCARRDSNPPCTDSKSVVSCRWTTSA